MSGPAVGFLSGSGRLRGPRMKRTTICALFFLISAAAGFASSATLPDGAEFPMWEKTLHFSKT